MIFQWTIASKGFIYGMQTPRGLGAGEGVQNIYFGDGGGLYYWWGHVILK